MAAPTFTITAEEPSSLMGPAPVFYHVNISAMTTGDSSDPVDCMFYWWLTPRGSSSLDDIPNRHRYVTDPRTLTSASTVTIAGRSISTQVDLCGSDPDDGGRQLITGFSQAYLLPEGEWTVNVMAVNPAGDSTTVTRDVTVTADTRTSATLKTSGGDYSDLSSALSWLNGAANRKLVIDNDYSETVDLAQMGADNAYITVDDPTSNTYPQISHDNTTGNTTRLFEMLHTYEGMVLECLDLLGSARAVTQTVAALRLRASRCAAVNVRVPNNVHTGSSDVFHTSISFDSTSANMDGNLLLNCEAAGSTGSGGYTVAVQGANDNHLVQIYGGTYGASVNESIFRTVDTPIRDYLKIMYGFYDNTAVQSKSTIRVTKSNYFNLIGNRCEDGDIWIGSATGTQASVQVDTFTLDGCTSIGAGTGGGNLTVKEAATNGRIRNCYFGATGIGLGSGTQGGGVNNNNDIRMYNCVSQAGVTSGGTAAASTTTGCEIKGNIITAGGMDLVTSICGTGSVTDNRVTGTLEADGVTKTISEWNALGMVGTDVEDTTTLGTFGTPTESVEDFTPLDVNPRDMWGYSRGESSKVGSSVEQGTPIIARRPILVAGDPLYDSSGYPVYDEGTDLTSGTNIKNYYGDQAVDQFILATSGVRMWIFSDSQFSGGYSRGLAGIYQNSPYKMAYIPIAAATSIDPAYVARFSSNTDAYLISSQYFVTSTTASDASTTVDDFFTDQGIGDPEELGSAYTIIKMRDPMPSGGTVVSHTVSRGTSQDTVYGDDENLDDTYMKIKMFVIAGGATDLDDGGGDITFNAQATYYDETDSFAFDPKNVTVPNEDSYVLNSSNNGAAISPFETDVFQVGVNANGSTPRVSVYDSTTSFDGKTVIWLPGYIQLYSDGTTPLDTIGVTLVKSASGENPRAFIRYPGAMGTSINLAGEAARREYEVAAYGTPTVLMFTFGHNSPTRSYSDNKAESNFQADYADLIYQWCEDVRRVTGTYPYVKLRIQWVGGSLDQDRHDEIIGISNALTGWGITNSVDDSFNYFGGETFDDSFTLDGSDLHPNDETASDLAYASFWTNVEASATATPGPSLTTLLYPPPRLLAKGYRRR